MRVWPSVFGAVCPAGMVECCDIKYGTKSAHAYSTLYSGLRSPEETIRMVVVVSSYNAIALRSALAPAPVAGIKPGSVQISSGEGVGQDRSLVRRLVCWSCRGSFIRYRGSCAWRVEALEGAFVSPRLNPFFTLGYCCVSGLGPCICERCGTKKSIPGGWLGE